MFLNKISILLVPLDLQLNRKHEMFLNVLKIDCINIVPDLTVNMKCFYMRRT